MKKHIALLLAVFMLTAALSACSDAVEQSGENTQAAAESTATAETTISEQELADPKLAALDWQGGTFGILYNGNELEPNLDFVATEENGTLLNDAVFKRNTFIETKHNLKLVTTYYSDSDIMGKVKATNASGDNAYQLVEANQNYSMTMSLNGDLLELSALTSVDTDKPYWNSNILEGCSIDHKNYFAYSDANVHAFGATPVTIFNKSVHEEYKFDNIYKLVEDGKWTFAAMSEMVKTVTTDITGDGQITKDDKLGMIANNFCVDCFVSGTGYMLITKDENDLPVLNYNCEEFYNIIESMKNLLSVENGMFLVDRTSTATEAREYWTEYAMTENRALFWIGNFKCVERLRSMETDFGVVPMPKLDENQENYAVHMQANIGAAMSVPSNVSNPDEVSVILEDIAYQSYLTVMPQYMEVLIQGQLVRDNDSLISINIIRNSYYCDLGFMLSNSGVGILGSCRSIITNNAAVASTFGTVTKMNEKALKKIVSSLTK